MVCNCDRSIVANGLYTLRFASRLTVAIPCRRFNPTHFAHRIDMLDAVGEIQEHLAGVEDYILAEAGGVKQSRGGRVRPSFCAKARGLFMTAAGRG
jgi:hypothetical protein